MKIRITLFIILILLLFSLNAYALEADGFEGMDFYLYYGTTADDVTIAWDHSTSYNATTDSYELLIHNPERNIDVNLTDTPETTFTFKCPKTGHWIPKVRSKRVVDGTTEYSDWAVSTDPAFATVDSQPRGWWLFAWIASPGPIITGSSERRIFLRDNH